jgi:hypothetical protein
VAPEGMVRFHYLVPNINNSMLTRHYKSGDVIPTTANTLWFVVKYGHFVKTVDLKDETIFPKLEDPETLYIAFG